MVGRYCEEKKNRVARLIIWLVFLYIMVRILPVAIVYFQENVMDRVSEEWNIGDDPFGPGDAAERPDEWMWNTAAQGYFEMSMSQGVYTVGYEIPAGTYQLYCDEGTAWIDWWDENGTFSDYAALYSLSRQESYAESFGECDYFELTDVWTLAEGDILYVESCDTAVRIMGEGEGVASLKEHDPQKLPAAVELKSGMTVGKELLPGVYDFILGETSDGGYASAYVTVTTSEDAEWYISLHDTMPEMYRFPLHEGDTIEMTKYGDAAAVKLVPSY